MASFFFDNDANWRIGRMLERLGHMRTSTHEQLIENAVDVEVLRWAAGGELILVTHNERDFVTLHWAGPVDAHAGILVVPQAAPGDEAWVARAIDALVRSNNSVVNQLYRLGRTGHWSHWNDDQHRWMSVQL